MKESETNGYSEDNEGAATPKMNAFQFMMNSRHKSIGRNSPGREISLNESVDTVLSKQELKVRKSKLEMWAQKKGAGKRKREYDEIGNCINEKLEQREKRLRKMLNVDCQSDDEVITKRRHKAAVIETDSERSSDEEEVETVKKKEKKRLSLGKKEENGDVELTPKSVKAWKFKIKLCMDDNKEVEEMKENHNMDECELVGEEENGDVVEEKRVLRTRKPKINQSDSDEEYTPKSKKKLRVAPVFLNSVPKPKIDPKVAEAKRQFLMSGVPSSLKKEMEKQCVEEIDFDVFPVISHVQQKTPDNIFWDLPCPDLCLTNDEDINIEIKPFSKELLDLESPPSVNKEEIHINKLKNCKRIIKEIKAQNPDYPVYKVFNSIYNKACYKVSKPEENSTSEPPKPAPKRRGRPKKNAQKPESPVKPRVKSDDSSHMLWTEKYKPTSSTDILGNHSSVSSLKDWLKNWLDVTKDLKKKKSVDSDSEFEITDTDSRDSLKMCRNTIVLKGPPGSGKTAAIYAVCKELGFNVLEVNASSKRTGKRLLQELQEATQSHQVCKTESVLSCFIKEKKEKLSTKMCLLLIEDIDVVFDQDEGFSAALSQIIGTTKRPIVLTTTEEAPPSIQRIVSNYQTILFAPLSSILTIWLQIVCLVEGFYIDVGSLDEMLSYNRGDIRRTLLQLQLYVSSGGQFNRSEEKRETEIFLDHEIKMDDDNSNLSEEPETTESVQIHSDCLDICHPVTTYSSFSLPHCNNLGVIWWNLPSILDLPNYSKIRLDRELKTPESIVVNKQQLKILSNCYDTLAFADILGHNHFHESLERRWRTKSKDGLGLEEQMSNYFDLEFQSDITQTLISTSFKIYKEKYGENGETSRLNMAVPVTSERRWRSKQLLSEEKLRDALLPSDFLARQASVLDYMPYLRAIARSETDRAVNKRGNRFYNYLRNYGVCGSEATYKLSCDVFKICD